MNHADDECRDSRYTLDEVFYQSLLIRSIGNELKATRFNELAYTYLVAPSLTLNSDPKRISMYLAPFQSGGKPWHAAQVHEIRYRNVSSR